MSEEERMEHAALPEFAEEGLENVAKILGNLPAEYGRADAAVYARDGDPQYLKCHEGEVSDQIFKQFEESLALEARYDIKLTEDGYILEI